jgi:alpha-L-fucosidase
VSDWFAGAGLGLFVHWDHASQQGLELSWPLVGGVPALPSVGDVPVEQYHSSAATFDPRQWDPEGLARLARRAGARYAVLTTKHHSGWSMFHTKLSDFSVEHSPYGRDIVAEFADAMRAEGLRVGFYYSLSDWHHPDYPAFTDADKPYAWGTRRPAPEAWDRYVEFLFGQVTELLTGYGPVDLIWFDGGWERLPDEWRSGELEALIRRLQPGIIINDRLPGAGDYDTPEQFVPPLPPDRKWETCMTMNESWGYVPADTAYKSSRRLVHTLAEVVGRGGNLLLNVSPMGNGALPPEQVERLEVVAGWMARHAEAVHDTVPGLEPWQFYGPATARPGRLYLHLLSRPYSSVTLRGVPIRRVTGVRVLATGAELEHHGRASIMDTLVNPDPLGELTIRVPEDVLDPYATVLAVDIDDWRP